MRKKYSTCPKQGFYCQQTEKMQNKMKNGEKRVGHNGGEDEGG